jgi:hypothetical protein
MTLGRLQHWSLGFKSSYEGFLYTVHWTGLCGRNDIRFEFGEHPVYILLRSPVRLSPRTMAILADSFCLPQFIHTNGRITPQIRPRPIPFTSFPAKKAQFLCLITRRIHKTSSACKHCRCNAAVPMARMRAEFVGTFGRHGRNLQKIEPRLRIVLSV